MQIYETTFELCKVLSAEGQGLPQKNKIYYFSAAKHSNSTENSITVRVATDIFCIYPKSQEMETMLPNV